MAEEIPISAGAPEPEITPEMIRAAAVVLDDQFDISLGIAAIVAEDVLRAALRAKSGSEGKP